MTIISFCLNGLKFLILGYLKLVIKKFILIEKREEKKI
jgi:hypothetical protein